MRQLPELRSGEHPLRAECRTQMLDEMRPGRHLIVRAGGAVIVRQRPGTAKGFVFLTLEDETGMCQAIVRPDLFREYRSIIAGSGTLVVEGKLQKLDGTLSVKGKRFWGVSQLEEVPSHDFH